jgi:hypothetical protein
VLNSGGYVALAAIDLRIPGLGDDSPVAQTPTQMMLAQNFPNPFNPSTTISFDIPAEAHVNLSVFNIRGQLVKTLVDEVLPARNHQVVWYGLDNNQRQVATGVYLYRLEVNGQSEVRRMLLMK